MRKENDGDSRGGAVRASLTPPRCSTNLLSLAAEKFGIPPLSKLGFADLPSILWVSLFCHYETRAQRCNAFPPISISFSIFFSF